MINKTLKIEDKIHILISSLIGIFAILFIIFRHSHIADWVFFSVVFSIVFFSFKKIIETKIDAIISGYSIIMYNISILIYQLFSFDNYYGNRNFVDYYMYIFSLILLITFLITLVLRKEEHKFQKIISSVLVISLSFYVVLYFTNFLTKDMFMYSVMLILIILMYIMTILTKREKREENQTQKQQQIEKLKKLYNTNASFFIHKIKNKFLPLQASIAEGEIEPKLKKELQSYIEQINGAINEFYESDELYKKDTFILKELFNSIELRYETILNRKKINFKIVYEQINSEKLINIPFHTLNAVIEILFDNSIEALKDSDNKNITIIVSKKGEFLIIQFCDTGIGIGDELKEKIFEEGFSTKEDGKGIGLNQMKLILSTINGKIAIGSNDNFNTIFEIKIPIK